LLIQLARRREGEFRVCHFKRQNDLKEEESCCIKIHREQERNRVLAGKWRETENEEERKLCVNPRGMHLLL